MRWMPAATNADGSEILATNGRIHREMLMLIKAGND